jgi:deoxyhypusine synthase
MRKSKQLFLSGKSIKYSPIQKNISVTKLVDEYFQAYNAGRLREAAQLFTEKMLNPDVTIGMSISGALTPAGLGGSCLVPLMKAGFVDWIVSTGANLYHDTHFSIGHSLYRGSPFLDDRVLRKQGIIRIYDILFDYRVLLDTDKFFREIAKLPEFQKEMGTAEFHYLAGQYIYQRERLLNVKTHSILGTAYKNAIPVYTSSPGDSSIGMNVAALTFHNSKLIFNIALDVNETAAIVLNAKRFGKSGVLIFGGGSPKNFVMQTEPQIQEILMIPEKGHDFFLQFTDARPDTGGLSGATPSEAVSWGKMDPDEIANTIVCYSDNSFALPLFTSYVLAKCKPRKKKRLYSKRKEMIEYLRAEHFRFLGKRKY